jgi:hypothetical protein
MPISVPVESKKAATGTLNLKVPISFFSCAVYELPNGKVVQMPVSVGGEHITGALQGTPLPQQ